MKMLFAAVAFAVASPALAQAADPHAGHAGHQPGKKCCCCDEEKKDKDCCADKGASGADAHAGHQAQ